MSSSEKVYADPRHRNKVYDQSSITKYLNDYAEGLKIALESVNSTALENAFALLERATENGNKVFAIGNGGSAAIADHLCCDLTKGTHAKGHATIDTRSLTSNVALYSAIANDYGFEHVFSTQLAFLARDGDVLLAISSSGNSPNIIAAVEAAHSLRVSTIGLSGFAGGKLKALAQVDLHVAAHNYGIVEDAHQALMHVLAQFIACGRDEKNKQPQTSGT